ncbi:PaaI family thioesterase [Amycolatopsis sp. K13G38]|uniref:PaaI family thioesterase n=1 Tax=Amycolatopsis acididurans TaxID=2724524 RepID=A0ABX1JH00_9PSEU|nr:PaaI family thioesterase [Amycolatopsis acididurans]NKQ58654.1 PaaI family thioesterase [Amycolatopsis acididurans]
MSVAKRIEELRALLDKGLAEGIGVGHSLGVMCAELGEGRTVYTLKPGLGQANAMLTVHGGVLSTLMDTAMGSAIFTELPDATAYTTLELKVNFIRPVALDDGELRCEATTVHVGRRTATAEARIHNAESKLVAHGSCTCLVQSF